MEDNKPTESQLRLIWCICKFLNRPMPLIKTREDASEFILKNDIIADKVRDIAFR